MRIKRNRLVPNVKGSGVKTSVRGIRAEDEFWELCDKVCELQKTNRNELLVRATAMYCQRIISRRKKK